MRTTYKSLLARDLVHEGWELQLLWSLELQYIRLVVSIGMFISTAFRDACITHVTVANLNHIETYFYDIYAFSTGF